MSHPYREPAPPPLPAPRRRWGATLLVRLALRLLPGFRARRGERRRELARRKGRCYLLALVAARGRSAPAPPLLEAAVSRSLSARPLPPLPVPPPVPVSE